MNPASPTNARLIVCESGRQWATMLRRGAGELRVWETRSDDGVLDELAASPWSVVVRETSPQNVAAALQLACRMEAEFPQAVLIAAGRHSLLPYEGALAEAGCVFVCGSLRKTEPILRIARRQLQAAPPRERTFREAVFDRMPGRRNA